MPSSANWAVDFKAPQIFLAPMEGLVDSVVRDMVSRQGSIDLCVTEFVRITNHLLPKRIFQNYCPELSNNCKTPSGIPVLVQLLGSDPNCIAENAVVAIEAGAAGIDLNFGCPAKTVNNHDGGATLLKQPSRLYDVISAVRKAVPANYSVSAKVRLGFDHKDDVVAIAQACQEADASWLTVHARTKTEAYKPPAHWEYIRYMKDAVQIPVIANGEIWTVEDFHRCREVSGCEHVMIGRGLIANPGLATEIKTGCAKKMWPEWQEVFIQFMHHSRASRSDNFAVQRSKQFAKIMSQSYGEAAILFEKIKRLMTFEDMLLMIESQWLCEETPSDYLYRIASKNFQTSPMEQVAVI
jgi:tRNA-dihydrouridine synthase C